MDTTRFVDDLNEIAPRFASLSAQLGSKNAGRTLLDHVRPARILILGMGSSRFAASRVARRARARGRVVNDEWASSVELPEPADDLVVVAVSATGSSAEVLTAVERYRDRGRLVAVTNAPDSPLASLADATTLLHAGPEVSGVACRTYRHTLVVLEDLLGLTTTENARRSLDAAAAATVVLNDTASTWLPPVAEVLDSVDGTHVLAPAERFCSAQQAALMVRELPRRLAVACETGDWAHVDVYTTRTYDYRAALLTGSSWDGQAVEWLRSRSARFVAIGGDLAGAEATVRFPGDEVESVRVLVETLPLELVADRWLAQDPDFGFSRRPIDRPEGAERRP